jgi:hypothetical protein
MNQKTNKWAYKVKNEQDSEVVQRIAFSFGYSWSGEKVVHHQESKYLIFNPDEGKELLYTTSPDSIDTRVCEIVLSGDYALLQARLQNPPKNILRFKSWIITKDGDLDNLDTELEIDGQQFRELMDAWRNFVEY